MAVADLAEVPRGLGPPLFLDQPEARRAEKNYFGDRPPLSEGLDPPLYGALPLNRCLSQAA